MGLLGLWGNPEARSSATKQRDEQDSESPRPRILSIPLSIFPFSSPPLLFLDYNKSGTSPSPLRPHRAWEGEESWL